MLIWVTWGHRNTGPWEHRADPSKAIAERSCKLQDIDFTITPDIYLWEWLTLSTHFRKNNTHTGTHTHLVFLRASGVMWDVSSATLFLLVTGGTTGGRRHVCVHRARACRDHMRAHTASCFSAYVCTTLRELYTTEWNAAYVHVICMCWFKNLNGRNVAANALFSRARTFLIPLLLFLC